MSLQLVLLGAPGAGKGTQAKRIASLKSILHLSTGDMLREAVAAGSELGRSARGAMDAGRLVPDDVMVGMVRERIRRADCDGGFLLDGFPRTRAQAEALEEVLAASGRGSLTGVVAIEIDPDVVVERMAGRRVCRSCGAPYHVTFNPPRVEGVCDLCRGKVSARDDDREETVRERLKVYEETSRPVKQYYEARSLLAVIDGGGTPDEVTDALVARIGKWEEMVKERGRCEAGWPARASAKGRPAAGPGPGRVAPRGDVGSPVRGGRGDRRGN